MAAARRPYKKLPPGVRHFTGPVARRLYVWLVAKPVPEIEPKPEPESEPEPQRSRYSLRPSIEKLMADGRRLWVGLASRIRGLCLGVARRIRGLCLRLAAAVWRLAEPVVRDVRARLAVRRSCWLFVETLVANGRLREAICVMEPQASTDFKAAEQVCRTVIDRDEYFAPSYRILGRLLLDQGRHEEAAEVGESARLAGLRLVNQGRLAEAVSFFHEAGETFPEACRPYAMLYGQIKDLTLAYRRCRAAMDPSLSRKRVLFSLSLWGESYTDLFLNYFIPSILSPNNVPALARERDVFLDLYVTAGCMAAIRESRSFRALARHADIQFIEIPEVLTTCSEYARNQVFRYYIYGGFHHASIERARVLRADIICLAPDGIYGDGCFHNLARFIDQGYRAVLFTAVAGQAETILPVLDRMRDDTTHVLTVPPRAVVGLTVKNVHHAFLGQIASKANAYFPGICTVLFFPDEKGFIVRAFHLHPIIMSVDCFSDDIAYDYGTVDANMLSRIFPEPQDWRRIKVITDSDDAVMLALTYAMPDHKPVPRAFSKEHIAEAAREHLEDMHFWNFSHRIHYRCDEKLSEIIAFDYSDGELVPKSIPLSAALDVTDEELAAYVDSMKL